MIIWIEYESIDGSKMITKENCSIWVSVVSEFSGILGKVMLKSISEILSLTNENGCPDIKVL